MRRRVVVTGLGCISPLGNDVDSLWRNILAGKSGVGKITHYDASEHKTRFAAQVKDFDPVNLFGKVEARRMDRFSQFALAAAQQAVTDSGLIIDDEIRDRIGVVIGTGIGGLGTLFEQVRVYYDRGPSRVSPFTVPMMLPDSGAGMIAIFMGIRGPNMAVVTACATGTNAVGEATEVIRRGMADVMLAGGSEAVIVPIAMASLSVMVLSLRAMTTLNAPPGLST